MKIKVNQYYGGWNTNNEFIQPGIYEVGDERLFGIEDYLVNDQQKAEYIEDEVIAPDMVADDPEDDVQELEFKGRTLKVKKAK